MTAMESNIIRDTVREVATPEGCEIGLRIAGPLSRARAWMFDFLLRLAVWIALSSVAGLTGNFGTGMAMVSAFLLEWFYPVLFEVFMRGQTPGKRVCGLAVLHDDGTPVSWGASFTRNTVRFVDFLPAFYATAFITTLLNADGKRLGDLAAGTVVVHIDSERPAASNQEPDERGAEPPPFPLSVDEQRTLIEYRNRVGTLTVERAEELAAIPTQLTGGLTPDQARRRLLRIANFLLGAH
jgi:uncharacterized RDD family membrane protein YckC